jgi:uncharacterized metal-binding protein YceD (DUF177 family)
MTAETAPAFSFVVEIDRLPSAGGQYDIAANAEALARVAQSLEVAEVKALTAQFSVKTGAGGIVHVKGTVHAELVQTCVVTLVPVPAVIDEAVEASFITVERAARNKKKAKDDEEELVIGLDAEDPPEIAEDGRIDLGELAVTQVALVLDPYPRAPGVSFNPAQWPGSAGGKGLAPDEAAPGPFAALAKLKKSQPN